MNRAKRDSTDASTKKGKKATTPNNDINQLVEFCVKIA